MGIEVRIPNIADESDTRQNIWIYQKEKGPVEMYNGLQVAT